MSIPPADCYVPRPVETSMAGYSPTFNDNWMYQSSSPLESQSQFIPETQFLRNTPRRLEQEISDDDEEETEETEDADYWMYQSPVEEVQAPVEEVQAATTDKSKAP